MTCTDHAEYAERIRKIVDSVLRLVPVQWWAFSPLDHQAHLLLLRDGDHPPGVFKARCAALLPVVVTVHNHRPPGRVCFPCELIARADLDAPVAR